MYRMNSRRNITADYQIFHVIDEEYDISVVTFDNLIQNNQLTTQGLKIGNKFYRLIFFSKTPTNFHYEFEKDFFIDFYFNATIKLIKIKSAKFKINLYKDWSPYGNVKWDDRYKELNYIGTLYN